MNLDIFRRDKKEVKGLNSETEIKTQKKEESWLDLVQSVIFALVICIIVYIFIAMPNQIQGDSMLPNFHDNEVILTSKLQQWFNGTTLGSLLSINYQRGDVIVFQKPGYLDFIKRIVGLPGENIRVQDGFVYINDKKLVEDYITGVYTIGGDFIKNNGENITIPADHYFVMGDNRGNSKDSRYQEIGFIDKSWMKGRVVFRYWPLQYFGINSSGKSELN